MVIQVQKKKLFTFCSCATFILLFMKYVKFKYPIIMVQLFTRQTIYKLGLLLISFSFLEILKPLSYRCLRYCNNYYHQFKRSKA